MKDVGKNCHKCGGTGIWETLPCTCPAGNVRRMQLL